MKKTGARRRAREAPAAPQPLATSCGGNGGTSADGTACQRPAGWGLWPGATRCVDHDDAAAAMLQGYKRAVLEVLEQPLANLVQAAEAVAKDPSTIWRWRKQDPAFDDAVVQALADVDELRVRLADESIFGRILSGKAHCGTEIFWMKNKAPARWQDRREFSGPNGQPLVPPAGAAVQTIMFGDLEVKF